MPKAQNRDRAARRGRFKKTFLNIEKGASPNYPDGKEDNTHFTVYGASIMASLVAEGIRELKLCAGHSLKTTSFKDNYVYELPKGYGSFDQEGHV